MAGRDEGLYGVHDVAARLGISAQAIREYVNAFRPLLSAHASPAAGQHRKFTDTDLQTLVLLRELRSRRELTHEQISAQVEEALRSGSLPPIPDPLPSRADVGGVVQRAGQQWAAERVGLMRQLEATAAEVERLRAALDEAQRGRLQDVERLARELADLQAQLAEAQLMLKLVRTGKLPPAALDE